MNKEIFSKEKKETLLLKAEYGNTFMKRRLFFILCFFALLQPAVFAQSPETFDVITFKPPTNWKKQATENSLQYLKEDAKTDAICIITLTKAIPAASDSKKNFDAAWDTIVKEMVTVSTAPEMQPISNENGWEVQNGYAPFEYQGAKGVVILVTATGGGKMANIVIFTNTDVYEKNIADFLGSVSLKKPGESIKQPVVNNSENDSSIIGTWLISASDQSSFRMNNAVMSYITRQYTFKADGTYIFYSKLYDPLTDKILLGRENGTYQISGNNLTVNPQKSVLEAWSKKDGRDEWGKQLNTQNRPLEKVTYQFTKHYFSGLQKWSIVLQADKVTQRDGPYSGGNAFNNAWIYGTPCDKCFIELPK